MSLNWLCQKWGQVQEVFEHPATLLAPYPDESINQALWDVSCNAFDALTDAHIEWSARRRFIDSFEPLYRDLFAAHCQPVLGHRSEAGSALNSSCYMWWDLLWYHEHDPRTDDACLESMRSILAIDHVACQEGALHGLGHWHQRHSAEVEGIIDEYLQRNPRLCEELRKYAGSARAGRVL